MNTLIHADIFFFITTIVVIVLALGVCIALFYIIRILRNFSDVSDKVKIESTEIIQDIKHAREKIKSQGLGFSYIKHIVGFLMKINKKRKAKTTKKEERYDEDMSEEEVM